MTTDTTKIVEAFTKAIDINADYSNREMQKILSDAFKAIKKLTPKKAEADNAVPLKKRGRSVKANLDNDGNVKEKKAPSEYNLYVKANYPIVKEANPDMNPKDIMKQIAADWKSRF